MNSIINNLLNNHNHIFCKFSLLFVAILLAVMNLLNAQPATLDEVSRHIDQRIETDELVGIYIARITEDGESTELSKGTLQTGTDKAVNQNSIFEIGSITKVFSTLLLARHLQEHDISLDDKAENYLPDGMSLPAYQGKKITLRHLVTHTSGLPSLPDNFFPDDPSNPYADYTLEELKQYLQNYQLNHAPGSTFAYSNMGMALIGHILEAQTGSEYEELVVERITEPLGMTETSIGIPAESKNRLAKGHSGGETVPNWDLPAFEAAGALVSTGKDMVRFLKAQMGLIEYPEYTEMKITRKPLYDIEKGLNEHTDKIGMGWFYTADKDPIIWHSGGTGGYRSFIGINKKSGEGVIVLSNTSTDIMDLSFHLLDERYPLKPVGGEVALSAEDLDRYVGEYQSDMDFSIFVTQEEEQLFARLTGQNRFPVMATAQDTFRNNQIGVLITFEGSDSNRVNSLTLKQAGQTIPAEKISETVQEQSEYTVVKLSETQLKHYVGTYQLTPNFSIKITLENDQLYAQATGQQKFPVYPRTETNFFYKVVEAELEFLQNEEDKFDRLILYQAGREIEGKKIAN